MTRRPRVRRLTVREETWLLREPFVIASLPALDDAAPVIVVEVERDGWVGRGEAEAIHKVEPGAADPVAAVEAVRETVEQTADTDDPTAIVPPAMPPGPARCALDCALHDLRSRLTGVPVWRRLGLPAPRTVETVFTLSLAMPDAMADAARRAGRPALKLKLGSGGAEADLMRVAAVRAAVPNTRLVADANMAWTIDELRDALPDLERLDIRMLEQPLPPGADEALAALPGRAERSVALVADEACHTRADLDRVAPLYDAVNVKLDKAGGLTEAAALARAARERGLGLMVGCMVGTSLAMAPAHLLAGTADLVDLDGPLLLSRDRASGHRYDGALMHPAPPGLWGERAADDAARRTTEHA